MHICNFNLEFVGLGYKPSGGSYNYSFKTFELYRCNKCKKLIYKNKEKHKYSFSTTYNAKIRNIERCGYKPLGKLVEK